MWSEIHILCFYFVGQHYVFVQDLCFLKSCYILSVKQDYCKIVACSLNTIPLSNPNIIKHHSTNAGYWATVYCALHALYATEQTHEWRMRVYNTSAGPATCTCGRDVWSYFAVTVIRTYTRGHETETGWCHGINPHIPKESLRFHLLSSVACIYGTCG